MDPGPAQRNASALARLLQNTEGYETFVLEEGDEPVPGRGRVVLGGAAHPQAAELARHLGLELLEGGGGFVFLGREYTESGDAVVASFPDPDRPGLPVVLFFGNDEARLAWYVTAIPRPWEYAVRVHSEGELAYRAPLRLHDGEVVVDEERSIDFLARRAAYWEGESFVVERDGLRVHMREAREGPVFEAFLSELHRTRANVQRWLGDARTEEAREGEELHLDLYLYDHPEDMELLFGEPYESFENPFHPRAHAPWSPFKSDAAQSLARVCARELQGRPSYPWLYDGVAIAATGKWWGRPLSGWISHLKIAGLMPGVNQLVDSKSVMRMSPHILRPARGFLFRFLMRGPMKGKGRQLWSGAPPGNKKLPVLFAKAVQKAAVEGAKARRGNPGKARKGRSKLEAMAAPFRHGVALSDRETEDLQSTYLARDVEAQLARASELGADALSVTVLAAAARRDTLVEFPRRFLASSASDLALVNALNAGRQLGMGAMLAVQPLATPASTWGDGGVLTDLEAREAFWESYAALATHYALFAQLAGVDILCIGANLREATKKISHNEAFREQRDEGWSVVIRKTRLAYRGAITYAAQLGELRSVEFWEDLDFIGVNFYPRMAKQGVVPRNGVVERACSEAIEDAITTSNRWNRPLLFVEVGFPARSDSWNRPNVPSGEEDGEEQRRYFELFAEALHTPRLDSNVLRGIYLWNWAADGEADPDRRSAFDLSHELAPPVLGAVFER